MTDIVARTATFHSMAECARDDGEAILKPFASPSLHWIVEQHGICQGYNFFHHIGLDRNQRDMFRGHPMFEATAEFVELNDPPALEPAYDSAQLSLFEPMVMRLFQRPLSSIYQAAIA